MLVDEIGRLPALTRHAESQTTQRRAWRRAALALDDLRSLVGTDRVSVVVAERHVEPELRRPLELARPAIDELRGPTRERRIGD